MLKENKLNDVRGALDDYERAIQADPQNAIAHYNRGTLKIDPNYAYAYVNRGTLKYNKPIDRTGGIADMQQAARLLKRQNNRSGYQNAIGWLRKWGVSEGN